MSIKPLPDSEVRLLASSLHIVSAATLVKELLDNAVDAKATSIEVIVSPDTVDQIEVRDNGTGIHADDYDSLGRRGHTSKLRRFEELNGRASKSLGFRGEALASVNSVAALTITTRTSTDPLAAVLQLTSKVGGVFNQRPGSAPVGTTISVRGLYSEMPVREQLAIKAAPKTLDSIKDLLRSYAAARPQLRLMLKISKSPKLTWSYAPKSDAGLREAALQLCGTVVTSQCFEKHSTIVSNTDSQANPLSFDFEACVPKPDADQHVLPKYQYISIDGRPMTASKGTAKKLLSMFRKFTSKAMETAGTGRSVKDTFICLNIKCPPGSYDVNVEPSKDDVLFEDKAAFLDCFEKFCSGLYGPISTSEMPRPAHQVTTPACPGDLATTRRTRPCIDTPSAEGRIPSESSPLDSIEDGSADNVTESLGLGTESDQVDRSVSIGDSGSHRHRPTAKSFSGWTTAGALLVQDQEAVLESSWPKQPRDGHGDYLTGCAEGTSDMAADLSEKIDEPRRKQGRLRLLPPATQRNLAKDTQDGLQATQSDSGLVTKSTTSAYHQANALAGAPMTPEPEFLRPFYAAPGDLESSLLHGPICSPVSGNEQSIMKRPARHPLSNSMGFDSHLEPAPTRRHVQPPWTPPSSTQKDQAEWENRYKRSRDSAGALRQTTISFDGPGAKANRGGPRITHETAPYDEPQDRLSLTCLDPPSGLPEPIREFQPRQNNPLTGTVGQGRDQSGQANQNQKAESNENYAFSNLCSVDFGKHEGHVGNEPIETSIPSGDPRAYLLRQQKSVAAEEGSGRPRKLRRVKSSLLPMENVPEHGETHYLLLMISVLAREVPKMIEELERYDSYITENSLGDGIDLNCGELQRIESRLDRLLSLWQEKSTGEKTSVESRLTESLKKPGGWPDGARMKARE